MQFRIGGSLYNGDLGEGKKSTKDKSVNDRLRRRRRRKKTVDNFEVRGVGSGPDIKSETRVDLSNVTFPRGRRSELEYEGK